MNLFFSCLIDPFFLKPLFKLLFLEVNFFHELLFQEVDDEPHQRNLHEDIIERSAENFIPHEPTDENLEKLQEKLSMVGKIVIDLKDPNRPRFTLNELRTVLMERNELKTKLIAVEEELADFKPK